MSHPLTRAGPGWHRDSAYQLMKQIKRSKLDTYLQIRKARQKTNFCTKFIRAESHKKPVFQFAPLGRVRASYSSPSSPISTAMAFLAFPPVFELPPSEKQGVHQSLAWLSLLKRGKMLPNSLIQLISPKAQTKP